jgi:GntR family transcriptional regulator
MRWELIRVDEGSAEAEYLQVAHQLRQQIIDGQLAVGEQLPSSRAVKDEYGVGRATYGRALGELQRQGLVMVRKGNGAYVTAAPAVQVVEVGNGDRVGARPPTAAERDRLGTGLLSAVLVVTRADGRVEVHPASLTVCKVTC